MGVQSVLLLQRDCKTILVMEQGRGQSAEQADRLAGLLTRLDNRKTAKLGNRNLKVNACQ
jgi:hypothetical protein